AVGDPGPQAALMTEQSRRAGRIAPILRLPPGFGSPDEIPRIPRRWRSTMGASAPLLLFGDEQICFPGIPRCAPPHPVGEAPPDPAGIGHCPGQLCFGHAQLLLADADPEPLQPSLIPEPPPWEADERSLIRRREESHRRAGARGASASDPAARTQQLGLFPRPR
ncbi:MAG: hypothetical protein ABR532_01495, partial [Candidatus Dormibacteria bacterium]